MPNLAGMMSDFTIVRSLQAWALVHSLAQTWTQIGRNPAGVLGNIAPNMGSVVAIEKEAEAKIRAGVSHLLALNSNSAAGSGILFPLPMRRSK